MGIFDSKKIAFVGETADSYQGRGGEERKALLKQMDEVKGFYSDNKE